MERDPIMDYVRQLLTSPTLAPNSELYPRATWQRQSPIVYAYWRLKAIVAQVRALPIDTISKLQGLVDLIYEKAIGEQLYPSWYAFLCGELANMEVCAGGIWTDRQGALSFHVLLIETCQREFVKNFRNNFDRIRSMQNLDDYFSRQRMKKSLGITRFIGELFNQDMLTVNLVLWYMDVLLQTKDDESLECLCKLLAMVAKKLEAKRVDLQDIFFGMMDVRDGKHEGISVRVRSMIGKLLDILDSYCEFRRLGFPKTLNQIQKELAIGHLHLQAMNSSGSTTSSDSSIAIQSDYVQKKPRLMDEPTEPKHLFAIQVCDSVTSNARQNDLAHTNITLKNIDAGGRTSCEPAAPELTLEQLEHWLKNIVEEYLKSCRTVRECDQDMKASFSPTVLSQLVSHGYISALEKSKSARMLRTGYLFAELIELGTLSVRDYCDGLQSVVEEADELIPDVPRVWEYLAELISPVLCKGAITLELLHQPLESLVKKNHASKLLACLFTLVIQDKGHDFLRRSWNSSGLTLTDFMLKFEIDSFIKENKLEFLFEAGNSSPLNQTLSDNHSGSYERINNKLLGVFKSGPIVDSSLWVVIFLKGYPDETLSAELCNRLKTTVRRAIDRIPTHLPVPRFHKSVLTEGVLAISCADARSKNWLSRLPDCELLKGVNLCLVDYCDFPMVRRAVVWIPGVVEDTNATLVRLARQNPALNTSTWKICERRVDEAGVHLTVEIDASTVKVLRSLEYQLFLDMGRVLFMMVDTLTRSDGQTVVQTTDRYL